VAGVLGIGILAPLSGIMLAGGQVNAKQLSITVFAGILAALVAGQWVAGAGRRCSVRCRAACC
jgi:hypothetical protein